MILMAQSHKDERNARKRAAKVAEYGEMVPPRNRDPYHLVAVQACRPKSEESFYPSSFTDLNHVLMNQVRPPIGAPSKERMRRIIAAGIPFQELAGVYTLSDGS